MAYNPPVGSYHGGAGNPPPPQWYGQHYLPPVRIAPPPRDPDPRRRWFGAYEVLRNLSVVLPLILFVLDVNIYLSGRGRLEVQGRRQMDPIFFDLYLSLPLVRMTRSARFCSSVAVVAVAC